MSSRLSVNMTLTLFSNWNTIKTGFEVNFVHFMSVWPYSIRFIHLFFCQFMSVLSVFVSVLSVFMLFLPSRPFCPFCPFLCPFCPLFCPFCPYIQIVNLCPFCPFLCPFCPFLCPFCPFVRFCVRFVRYVRFVRVRLTFYRETDKTDSDTPPMGKHGTLDASVQKGQYH